MQNNAYLVRRRVLESIQAIVKNKLEMGLTKDSSVHQLICSVYRTVISFMEMNSQPKRTNYSELIRMFFLYGLVLNRKKNSKKISLK